MRKQLLLSLMFSSTEQSRGYHLKKKKINKRLIFSPEVKMYILKSHQFLYTKIQVA